MVELLGIPTMVFTREGFSQIVGNGFAGFGFPTEGPSITEFPLEMFMPDSDLTPIAENIDKIVYGLTKWEPNVKEKGVIHPGENVTVQGKDASEALVNVNNLFLRNMWRDGLPIVPPTEERIDWILTGTDLPRETAFGKVVPRGGIADVRSVAITLAMAGGRPEYMPVLIAALEALLDPAMAMGNWTTTTCSTYPVVIVNGPIGRQIRLSSGYGCLGPDPIFPAGGSIGHAIRLILMNLGGAIPGLGTMSLYGGANRYTNLVFAEDEVHSEWPPLSVDWGFSAGENAVTTYSVANTMNVCCVQYGDAEQGRKALEVCAQHFNYPGQYGRPGDGTTYDIGAPGVLLLPFPVANCLADNGWSKEEAKTYLWEQSTMNPGGYYKEGYGRAAVDQPITAKAENFIIAVCGGAQAMHAYWMSAGCCNVVPASQGITLPPNWDELLAQAEEDLGPMPAG